MVTGPDVAVRRVKDVARDVVAIAAPGETAYFDDLSAQFFDNPAQALHPAAPRDEPTGSGAQGAAELITSVVVAAVSGTLSDEIKTLITAAGRRGRSLLRWRARRMLRARRDDVLNGELRAGPGQVRDSVMRMKLELVVEIDAEQTERIVAAVFNVMSRSKPDERNG
jgi:hypothetical protein